MLNDRAWKKGEMSRTIVLYSIKIMTAVLLWGMIVTTVAPVLHAVIDISPVMNFTAVTFGGELILLAFKRVYAKKNEEVF